MMKTSWTAPLSYKLQLIQLYKIVIYSSMEYWVIIDSFDVSNRCYLTPFDSYVNFVKIVRNVANLENFDITWLLCNRLHFKR